MSRSLVANGFLATALLLPCAAASQPAIDGTWRTEGYGMGVRIAGDSLRTYEITSVSCLPGFSAHRTGGTASAPEFTLDGAPFTFSLLAGADASHRRIHIDGTASDMLVQRADNLPARCGQEPAHDNAAVFEVFWQTFREHYPFFRDRGIDWRQVHDTWAPRAAAAATPQELFAVLREVLEPMHDAHTFLSARGLRLGFEGKRPDPYEIGDSGRARVREIIDTRYLRAAPRSFANDQLQFGMLPDSIGYLRINSFFGYHRGGGYASWVAALDSALDAVFADTRGWRGLVIDVRVNGGGSDPLGLAIASRLTGRPYTAYRKVARSDPDDPSRLTAPQPSIVRPATRPGWHGPVVELTSRYSVSAAETFTQALMGRRPAVQRVGENTQGVFSDVLTRGLPNGWKFGLPNELFLADDGKSYDGPGIPPTIAVPTFTADDLSAGRDPGLERAIELLKGR